MYNKIKKHWDNQYPLSTNKVLAEFRRSLSMGGAKARDFIAENPALAETALGGHEEVVAVIAAITKDKEAVENQAYFFKLAIGQLLAVRALLARKYAATVRYCEQMGIDPADLTPETLLPTLRVAEERGLIDPMETEPQTPSIAPDPAPGIEVVADGAPSPADLTPETEPTGDTEGLPELEAEDTTELDETAGPATITEDYLKMNIRLRAEDGASKTDVWQNVMSDAKAIGWTSRDVWAYYDEITPEK
jgi:hypothetical protein